MALAWTMDKVGPLARSAQDCALVLAAIAGKDAADPSSVDRGFRAPAPEARRRRWKIAVPKGAADGIQAEVAQNFTAALQAFNPVPGVVPHVAGPDLPFGVGGGTIIAAGGASAFDDLFDGGRGKDLTAP